MRNAPLVEKYKPTTLDAFVGMEKPRAILQALVADPYPSAWLLLGASGTGKTTMALAVAQAIGGEVHHIPSRQCDLEAVDKVCGACHYYPWSGQWHFVLVDEADQMSKPAQLAFLSKLDTTAAPPNTIFLFTANDTAQLADRFLARVRTIRYETKDLDKPAALLLSHIWQAEAPGVAEPDIAGILAGTKNNIRAAIMELEMELVVARSTPRPAAVKAAPAPAKALTAAEHNARAAELRRAMAARV